MSDANSPKPVSVLFVCLGNICRSTMAEGVFQSLASNHPLVNTIDSCGTGAYHIGSQPDSRTLSTLAANDIKTYRHRARQFKPTDFDTFDYIFAMDADNLEDLERMRGKEVKKRGGEAGLGKVMLFGEFGGKKKAEEIVDPYYGGNEGFRTAFEQAGRMSKRFLEGLEKGELS